MYWNIPYDKKIKSLNYKLVSFAFLYVYIGILIEKLSHKSIAQITALIKISDLVTLLAAFFGAYLAFYFQNSKEKDTLTLKRIDSLREALFLLSAQNDRLTDIYQSYLKIHQDNPNRWMALPPQTNVTYHQYRVDLSKLYFLISEFPNQLIQIELAQQYFFHAIDAMNYRNDFHINQYQVKLGKVSETTGVATDSLLFENQIGERIFKTLTVITNNIYDNHQLSIDKIQAAIKELHLISKTLFPEETFPIIHFESLPHPEVL